MRWFLRFLLNGLAIFAAAWFVPGVHLVGAWAAVAAGVVLGFVNAIVKPVLFFLTLPVTLLTLGLFIFVVNAACLALTAAVVPGFDIDGFWPAVVGALVVSIVSWVLNAVLPDPERR